MKKDINFHKSLDILTKNLKSYPLSNYDILNVEPNVKFTISTELKYKRFADELVNSQGIGVLLWLYKPNEGHYLGLIRNKATKQIEIFDSYAFSFNNINSKLGSANMGVSPEILINLITSSGYKPVFNKKRLQSLKPNDNSCGRYVLLRLSLYQYDINTFHQVLNAIQQKHNINPLELAVLTTFKEIQK